MGLIGVVVYDMIILTWAQVTYFQSQETNCIDTVPILYFWLMGQILFFYVVLAFVLCYMCRTHCQNPKFKRAQELREEEAARERFDLEKDSQIDRNDDDIKRKQNYSAVTPGQDATQGAPNTDRSNTKVDEAK